MATVAEVLRQAFAGQPALVAAMRAQRARELAEVPPPEQPAEARMQVLLLAGAVGRWALPVAQAARVEPLAGCLPLPSPPPPVLGLALLDNRRCLLMDPEVVLAAAPCRSAARPGHAVLLREHAAALAVDRAEAVAWLPCPAPGARVLADGSLLVDVARLMAAATRGGGS